MLIQSHSCEVTLSLWSCQSIRNMERIHKTVKKMFNINLWSCKFLLVTNEWQMPHWKLLKTVTYWTSAVIKVFMKFSWFVSDGCFVLYLRDSCESQFDPNISLCVSQWEAGARVLFPLAGKSVVITSTSGHFYGPFNWSTDHYFIFVKYHSSFLLLSILEILTHF